MKIAPILKYPLKLRAVLTKWLQKIKPSPSSRTLFLLGFIGLSVTVTLLLAPPFGSAPIEYKLGEIIRADIYSPTDLLIVDEEATEKLRQEEAARVAPVFQRNSGIEKQAIARFNETFVELRGRFNALLIEEFGAAPIGKHQIASPRYKHLVERFIGKERSNFPLGGGAAIGAALVRHQFDEQLRRQLADALANTMRLHIYADSEFGEVTSERIRIYDSATEQESELPGRSLINLSAARLKLRSSIQSIGGLSSADVESFFQMLLPLVIPNIHADVARTEQKRQEARNRVAPIKETIRQGQKIAEAGYPATQDVLRRIGAVHQVAQVRRGYLLFIGLFVVSLILLFALWQFAKLVQKQGLSCLSIFGVIALTLLIQVVVIRLGLTIAGRFSGSTVPFTNDSVQYSFAIPYAVAPLIVALLIDSNLAFIYGLVIGLMAGLASGGSLEMAIYAAISSSAAVYGVERYRQRNAVTHAAVMVSLLNVLAAIVIVPISGQSPPLRVYLFNALYAILGGILTAALVSLAIPVIESLFNILTDVKLLELLNPELPLLRRLAMQAPGTYQHSLMVSSLAEAASKAIGANSLLVRIGCYYHDIGKSYAPNMYIENQKGSNPHDLLDPLDSARIITGHVRRGVRMGKEAKLPPQIIDLIPQHHGTRVLHYFYNKAREQAAIAGRSVNIEDFRYAGPKPQSKEAAIVMLADAAEAAARSLDDPSPEHLRDIVKKISDDIIADGQLDESNLTLGEINLIRDALVAALIDHNHQRISYPGFNPPAEEEDSSNSATVSSDRARARAC